MFCTLGLIFDGTEGDGPRFHVLRCRTRFRWYRGRWVQFSFFALPGSFWAVPRVLGLVFMFCAPGHVLGGTEGAQSSFHILRSQNRLGWYRGRQVQFSWFALLESISTEPREPSSVFMFCAPGLNFGGTEVVGSRLNVLRSQTRFGPYQGRRVRLSCFAPPKSFSALPTAPSPVFIFCASRLVFWNAKHENGTRRTRHGQKRVRTRKP
jgi:hypothetical protein